MGIAEVWQIPWELKKQTKKQQHIDGGSKGAERTLEEVRFAKVMGIDRDFFAGSFKANLL